MKTNKVIIHFFIISTFLFLGFSFQLKSIAYKVIANNGLVQVISHRLMDFVFQSVGDNMDILSKTQVKIEDSKEMKVIVKKLVDSNLRNISVDYDSFSYTDISKDIKSLKSHVVEVLDGKINNESLSNLKINFEKQRCEIISIINESAYFYIKDLTQDKWIVVLIKIYVTITSTLFKLIGFLTAIVLSFKSFKNDNTWLESIKLFSIDFLIVGVIFLLLTLFGTELLNEFSNRFLGKTMKITKLFLPETILFLSLGTFFGSFYIWANNAKRYDLEDF